MSDVTQLLERIELGDVGAADELLLILYDQLRRLASGHMRHENQTLRLKRVMA